MSDVVNADSDIGAGTNAFGSIVWTACTCSSSDLGIGLTKAVRHQMEPPYPKLQHRQREQGSHGGEHRARQQFTTTLRAAQNSFRTRQFPNTTASMPLRMKVLNASAGVFTIGSPFRLNDVFNTTGTPVASPKRLINR